MNYKKLITSALITIVVAVPLLPFMGASAADNEITSMRTLYSKTYDLGGTIRAVESSTAPIHYESGGNLVDIDTTFRSAVAPYSYQMIDAGYNVRARTIFSDGQIIDYSVKGQHVFFQPMTLKWTNDISQIQQVAIPHGVTPQVSGNSLTWNDAYGNNIDFQYIASNTQFIKLLTIAGSNDLPPPQQYIIDGGNPKLTFDFIFAPDSSLTIFTEGNQWDKKSIIASSKPIEFRYNGETIFVFVPPVYWDSAGNTNLSSATLSKVGNSLYVSVSVPYSWLQTATYPVYIDPTVDTQVAAEADDGVNYEGTTGFVTVAALGSYDFMGDGGLPTYGDSNWFVRFTGVTLEGTITTAYLSFYPRFDSAGSPLIKIYGVDEDNPAAPTTAGEYAADALTTAAIDWDTTSTKDVWKNTDSIVSVVQELVDSYTISNEAVMFQLKDDGSASGGVHKFRGYTGSAALAPKLYVEYDTAGGDPPLPPANVSATDGDYTANVTVTWDASVNATDYRVWRDSTNLGLVGNVTTYADTGANTPTITSGSAAATDGSSTSQVSLSVSGQSSNNGTAHTYRVQAYNAVGYSDNSSPDDGYRGVGSLTYQWQRSSGDADSGYSNIAGATSSTYNDTAAPAPTITAGTASATDGTEYDYVTLSVSGESANAGAGRYYQVVLNATGAAENTSASDRGYIGVGSLTYQWERSAADSDASYSTLSGATTDPYNDTTGVVDPNGRYYRVVLDATGATTNTTAGDRGYRQSPSAPTVTTIAASSVTYNSTTLSGNVTDTGGGYYETRFFEWGLSSGNYTDNWSDNTGSFAVGVFNRGISGLSADTTYYFRPGAANEGTWGYGSELSFTTETAPTTLDPPTAFTITDLGGITATLSWTKGSGANNTAIYFSRDDYPGSVGEGELLYFDTGTSTNVTGLDFVWSVYYFSAWSESGDNYSDTYVTTEIGGDMEDAVTTLGSTISNMMLFIGELIFVLGLVAVALWRKNIIIFLMGGLAITFIGLDWMQSYMGISVAIMAVGMYLVFCGVVESLMGGPSTGLSAFKTAASKLKGVFIK